MVFLNYEKLLSVITKKLMTSSKIKNVVPQKVSEIGDENSYKERRKFQESLKKSLHYSSDSVTLKLSKESMYSNVYIYKLA